MNIDEMERLFSEGGKESLFNFVRLELITHEDWQEWSENSVKKALKKTFTNYDEFVTCVVSERYWETLESALSQKEMQVYKDYLKQEE